VVGGVGIGSGWCVTEVVGGVGVGIGGGWWVVEFGSGTTSTNIQQGHMFGRKYNQMARAWPQGIKTLAKPLSTFEESPHLNFIIMYINLYMYIGPRPVITGLGRFF
jgi:hypothetical protein